MNKYISDIIAEGEHQKLDFKFVVNDLRKIARTLVAFSNSDGGKLLIGVKDNGKIAGIQSEEEYQMLEGAAKLYCKPDIKLKYKSWLINGKTILEVNIKKGNNRPYYVLDENQKWIAYFRQDDENHPANNIMIRVWKQQGNSNGVLLHFSKKEEFLLSYLKEIEKISLPEFCKIAGINKAQASSILSKLISLRLVDMYIKEGEFYYFTK